MKSALANACGITYQSVKGWFDGSTKTITAENLAAIAKEWNASLVWLIDGTGTMEPSSHGHISNVEETTEEYRASQRRAPVISWVQAGEWQSVEDPFEPGTADEWEIIPASAGPNSFWLRVIGDSMTAPSGVSVPEGMLILVDPDYPALSGRLVVAKLTDSQQVTFKKYVEDAGRKYLKPLNPSYSMLEINGNCRIIGGVREAKVKL
jgi:SOS-response transcriptional repressor LexA